MSSTTQLDANQVVKKVYDDASGAFKMVPASVGSTVLFNAVSAGANQTSTIVNILSYKVMGIMVTWVGLTSNGAVQFQGSVDGITFTNIGSATTLTAAAGAQDFGLVDEPYAYIQLLYSHGTNATGTVSAVYMLRA